jgi:hypothetical protein
LAPWLSALPASTANEDFRTLRRFKWTLFASDISVGSFSGRFSPSHITPALPEAGIETLSPDLSSRSIMSPHIDETNSLVEEF